MRIVSEQELSRTGFDCIQAGTMLKSNRKNCVHTRK